MAEAYNQETDALHDCVYVAELPPLFVHLFPLFVHFVHEFASFICLVIDELKSKNFDRSKSERKAKDKSKKHKGEPPKTHHIYSVYSSGANINNVVS